jgi:membrane dipeptidase
MQHPAKLIRWAQAGGQCCFNWVKKRIDRNSGALPQLCTQRNIKLYTCMQIKQCFMARLIVLLLTIFIAFAATAQNAAKIHRKAIVIDTHNDILSQTTEKGLPADADLRGKTHSDLNRWRQGGLDAQVFSIFCDGDQELPFNFANRQLDSLDAIVARNPDKIVKAFNSKDLVQIARADKIAAMSGIEGGHMIENNLNNIDSLYKRGARYITLTWNNSTAWATSALDETFKNDLAHKGLTSFGKDVVKRMNSLGMIVDISHVGEQTFNDVIQTSTKPIIASHSAVYALCPHQRNLKDDQIRAIAKNGGVIQVNFYSGFLDSNYMKGKAEFIAKHQTDWDSVVASGKATYVADGFVAVKYAGEADALRAPFELLIAHIEYIIRLVGVDYVGLGSDFDGIEAPPKRLDDVTKYPLITQALADRGYNRKQIFKILGGNFLRVLKANESH